ncbi:15056_t:CDS:2, partial [Gigaspora margarita]
GFELDEAWEIVTRTFAFTNHTIFPEAMEKWPVPMVAYLLPRHMQIIFDLNLVEKLFPDSRGLLAKLSKIEEATPQFVRIIAKVKNITFSVIHRYISLRKMSSEERYEVVKRVIIFGGKQRQDESIEDALKVDNIRHFTEASGISNMKFVLNGGLILGTVDGANIEIHREIEVINDFESGHFDNSRIFSPPINTLTIDYLISDDFDSYLSAQNLVDEAYKNQDDWTRMSILCTARMGKFSS